MAPIVPAAASGTIAPGCGPEMKCYNPAARILQTLYCFTDKFTDKARLTHNTMGDGAMAGLHFEDFVEGQVFDHEVRRTVSEYDNTLFSCLTMNTQPLHLDAEFSKNSIHGQRIVNSMFTLALVVGVQVTELTLGTTLGNLGMTDVAFPRPVFHGDTIHARTTILSKRVSQKRTDSGIVNFLHEGFNQHDELVATCKRTALMKTKSA